jgi:hypothetical protein
MNTIRNGAFNSSEIVALVEMGSREMTSDELVEYKKANPTSKAKTMKCPLMFSKGGQTFIKQTNQERKAKRSLDTNESSRATTWGKLVERWLMYERPDIIGLEYTLTPNTTLAHPLHSNYWVGSRDGLNNKTKAVIDIKCPYTIGSFCNFADCIDIEQVREEHTDGEKYYWQLTSNACIGETDKAELIVYIPNLEDLAAIQQYAVKLYNDGEKECYFIANASYEELPYLPKESLYKNKIVFQFDIPEHDLDFLTNRVILAAKNLIP